MAFDPFPATCREHLLRLAFPLCLLPAVWLLYLPGIEGGTFFFDDLPNLSVLGSFGQVDTWREGWAFLKSGIAGPTGRPLSLLTFLFDGRSWPTDPRPFLRTNVLLHGFNGALVFLCTCLLLPPARYPSRYAIAALTALWWSSHPYWASTVLYAVQRMAMLSAFFVLLGMAGYLWGRRLTRNPATARRGWLIAFLALCLGTGLAVISKENGALLPTYLLVVEWIIIRQTWELPAGDAFARLWTRLLLVLPSCLIIGYLVYQTWQTGLFEHHTPRPFSPYERLLTEPRILFRYLYDLLIPKPGYPGLFYDNYPFSTGPLSPPQTLAAMAGLAGLAGLGVAVRRKAPLLAFAILFYLAGHLVESTVLPLELAFEHRNYLPAAFLFLPAAAALLQLPSGYRRVTASVLTATLALFCFQQTTLWGNPVQLGVYWALKNPDSDRATILAFGRLQRSGNPTLALRLIERALARRPASPALNLASLGLKKALGELSEQDIRQAVEAVEHGPYDPHVTNILGPMVDDLLAARPVALAADDIVRIISAFERRREYARSDVERLAFLYQRGRIALTQRRISSACRYFATVARETGRVGTDLKIMSDLATYGYLADARAFLRMARQRLNTGNRKGLRLPDEWYQREFTRLASELNKEESKHGTPPQQCLRDTIQAQRS